LILQNRHVRQKRIRKNRKRESSRPGRAYTFSTAALAPDGPSGNPAVAAVTDAALNVGLQSNGAQTAALPPRLVISNFAEIPARHTETGFPPTASIRSNARTTARV